MASLGLRQRLLQDATFFMRLLHRCAKSTQVHILHEYRILYCISETCREQLHALDPERSDFLTESQRIFRSDLENSENAVLHIPLIRHIRSDRLSEESLIIFRHMFGKEAYEYACKYTIH
eukprot:2101586-Pleurochrysis_carterae.AAC.1